MAVNKVVYDGNTLIDLTADTVTAEALAEGETAHDASGKAITGTMTAVQYGKAQSLSDTQKEQARSNIGAISSDDVYIAKIKTPAEEYAAQYQVMVNGASIGTIDVPKSEVSAEEFSKLSAEVDAIGTQEEIVQQVIAALGTPVFGTVDAEKNITLKADALADGTYTVFYEDAEGNKTTIGTLTAKAGPKYTNLLPLAIGSDGKPYNGGKGWKAGTRLNSSGAESTSSATEIEVTGFIPVKNGDVIYLSGITMNNGTYANQTYMWLYDSSFTKMNGRYRLFSQWSTETMNTLKSQGLIDMDENGNITKLTVQNNVFYTGSDLADLANAAYFRISCEHIDDNSIITVNEPIE